MINSIYFASEREIITGTRSVALGFGFTPEGRWRGGLPEAEVLAVDERGFFEKSWDAISDSFNGIVEYFKK